MGSVAVMQLSTWPRLGVGREKVAVALAIEGAVVRNGNGRRAIESHITF